MSPFRCWYQEILPVFGQGSYAPICKTHYYCYSWAHLHVSRELTSADLSQLPILNAVIKESLRMLLPVGLGSFLCTKVDTQVRRW